MVCRVLVRDFCKRIYKNMYTIRNENYRLLLKISILLNLEIKLFFFQCAVSAFK